MNKFGWKEAALYVIRGLLRWIAMLVITMALTCIMIYILEDPSGRMVFYFAVMMCAAYAAEGIVYGKGRKRRNGRKNGAVAGKSDAGALGIKRSRKGGDPIPERGHVPGQKDTALDARR